MERTTRLATEFVDVNFKVYDCNTGNCVDEFNMQCEFPKGWGVLTEMVETSQLL